ncbi:MAG TPA: hypothetical protein VNF07_06075 [Acidimicrobiales bacterium]|nr:hypothetical protein [Acidimicrobiales bacterium]
MSDATDHQHVASNGRAELSLDQLAELHGGLAKFMLEISDRATRAHQAGVAKNRRVCLHQIGELTKTLRLSVLVRPQYQEAMDKFISEDLAKVRAVVDAEEWEKFPEAWEDLTLSVNANHEEFDHGYLVWKVPTDASSDLDLTPRG